MTSVGYLAYCADPLPGIGSSSTLITRRTTQISLAAHAVSDRVLRAVRDYPSGSIVVRATDGGWTWPS